MSSDLQPQELVLRFLASIGRPAEAQQYLQLFRADQAERFAILHVSHAVLRDALDALTVDLRFLHELGLRPVIVIGAERARNAAAHSRSATLTDSSGACAALMSPGPITTALIPAAS